MRWDTIDGGGVNNDEYFGNRTSDNWRMPDWFAVRRALMVEALKSGTRTDDDRFDEIYRTHRPRLVRFARRRNAIDPEGIADLALFDGYRALNRLRSDRPEVLESYLYKAAHSHVLRERRKPHDEIREVSDELTGASFEEQVVGDAHFESMLDHLSDDQRKVLQLRFVERLNTVETASHMGKSEVAVRQLQTRAVRRLRRIVFTSAVLVVLVLLAAGAWVFARSEEVVDLGPVDRLPRVGTVEEEPEQNDANPADPAELRIDPQDLEPTETQNEEADLQEEEPTDTQSQELSAEAVTLRGVNVAHGKPVRVSSTYSDEDRFASANAVDGDRWTRWSSAYLDNEWLEVDLGQRYEIDRVLIQWESAYASAYRVEVSDDQESWSVIYSTTDSDGETDDLVGLSGSGRYLRLVGEKRATPFGISPWALEVYGPEDNLALFKPTQPSSVEDNNPNYVGTSAVDGDPSTRWSSGFFDDQLLEIDLGKPYEIGRIVISWNVSHARAYRVEVSDDQESWSPIYSTADSDGATDDLSGLSASGRYVRLVAEERATGWGISIYELEIFRP